MTELIPEGTSRLLLVEGKEDKEFFIQLHSHLKFPERIPWILKYEGKDKLKDKLSEFLYQLIRVPNSNFKQVSQIGIVRDADYGTDAFQSVQTAIKNANANSPRQLPVPRTVIEPSEGSPKVSVLILPSEKRDGMLEDLVLDALNDDPITPCVDDFFTCLKNRKVEIVQERLSKARVRVFITGKNVDRQATVSDDTDKLRLSDIYKMSWWRGDAFWKHESFDEAKAFLRQLVFD